MPINRVPTHSNSVHSTDPLLVHIDSDEDEYWTNHEEVCVESVMEAILNAAVRGLNMIRRGLWQKSLGEKAHFQCDRFQLFHDRTPCAAAVDFTFIVTEGYKEQPEQDNFIDWWESAIVECVVPQATSSLLCMDYLRVIQSTWRVYQIEEFEYRILTTYEFELIAREHKRIHRNLIFEKEEKKYNEQTLDR